MAIIIWCKLKTGKMNFNGIAFMKYAVGFPAFGYLALIAK